MSYLLGEEDKPKTPDRIVNEKRSKRSISVFVPLVSAIGIYFIASVLFLIFKQIPSVAPYADYSFLFALPVVFITLSVFSFIWWHNISQCICLSILIWSTFASIYTAVDLFTNLPDFKYIFFSSAILHIICIIVFVFVLFKKKNKWWKLASISVASFLYCINALSEFHSDLTEIRRKKTHFVQPTAT